MKLELTQKLSQQQVLAPQMILSMDILLLPALDLEQRIQQEFMSNPALEIVDYEPEDTMETAPPLPPRDKAFERLGAFEEEPLRFYDPPRRRRSSEESDSKHEALQNTPGRPPGLKEHLTQQVHILDLDETIRGIAEAIINNLDHRGYLAVAPEEIASGLWPRPSDEEFQAALAIVRSLDPPGVGALDLKDCLLLQLERDPQDYPLERQIILNHLEDLAANRIPKIARELNCAIEDVKEAVEIITSLDPLPGVRLEDEPTIYIRPDVIVREVEGELEVHVDNSWLPKLKVSDACRALLRTRQADRQTKTFLRRNVESAQWLIQAIEQRQRTLQEIAVAIVEYQRDFMLHGPEHLRALKMQTIADMVGVHISTISRAIKGKYMETPQGTFEMRYFFTGGVSNDKGELESRRNIYRRIEEIIRDEDKKRPYSDTQLARILRAEGLHIARRTVTKYREQQGIPPSRLRKQY